jgi:hypothetical protein
MKFEDVKNGVWGLLERSDFFEDGVLVFLDADDSEIAKLGDVYELSFTTSNGSASGKFMFFEKMSDLHIFVEENDIDIEISYHDDNSKIITFVF